MAVTSNASTTRQVGFCGRDSEMAVIREEVGRLADGTSAVVIIEGGAGMGKSRLLAEVVGVARTLGVRVGASAADPAESMVELAALLAALSDASSPLVDRDAFAGLRAESGQRFWLLRDLESLLERAALEAPIMIAIDDVHWADSGTAAALRTLPIRLSGLPIAWIFALRPPDGSTPVKRALDELQRVGALTVSLGPLDGNAVDTLTREVLGGEADDPIRRLVDDTRGSPFLLVELLLGLRDENRVRVLGGRAELLDERLPNRVQDGMRERLGRLSEASRTVVTVAASLGRTFSFDELARTIGSSASEILAPVGELIAADLLVELDDKLAFWHDITREAVRASIPVSARRALDRQAAGVLLEAGALPIEVAAQLAASAEPGDDIAVATLLDAAEALVATDSETAAQFGRRALEIAPTHHPRRGELVGITAIALHMAGRSEEAIAFADTALREILPSEQEAEVRLRIAGMFAISPEIRIASGRAALMLSDVPEVVRARHLACLFHNLVTAGRIGDARTTLEEARAAIATTHDVRASFTLRLAESALDYVDDRFSPALGLVTAAYRDGIFAGDDQRLRLAHMWHGEVLSVLDRDDQALAIASDGLAAAQRDRQGWAYRMFEVWHGRMLLRVGRLSEAAAVLDGRFDMEDGSRTAAVLDAAGIVALGRLAIHTGDRRQLRRLTDIAHVMFDRGTPAVAKHAAWLLALAEWAEGHNSVAHQWLGAPIEAGGGILPRFPLDIGDEVLLMRIALAAHDDDLARLALATTSSRAAQNPAVQSIAAVAAHVRALFERDAPALREAADLFETCPRPLEHASALEDLGAQLAATDREASIEALGRALTIYSGIGASWDARRVRSRLRALGVRRRIVTAEPETHGWAALTAAEMAVARLAAEGLTNREVADRLFLSPHTVNSHLRHVFTKLRINSRVELVRFVSSADVE
jgi:DNA-binding CsgD family transcriptional regulator